MVSIFGHSVYHFDVLTVWFCLLAVSQAAYDNVALHKTAYQTNPYRKDNDSFDASNAVDGLKSNLAWSGGQCAVSALKEETATWWVDLGSIHSIHHITLYYRTENKDWDYRNNATSSFLGFSLYVSNTSNRLQGTLCFKDDHFNRSTIPAVFNTTCPVQGQYVIYYNERLKGVTYPSDYNQDAENDLCEVEVYGCQIQQSHFDHCAVSDTMTCKCLECQPGFHGHQCETKCGIGHYGYNCNETCGYCIDSLQCSTVNGTCLTGCRAGYVGPLCKEECDMSHYGYNCNETCGHCKDPAHCSPVYGTCLTGCRTGYFGSLCKEDCDNGHYGYNCNETCGYCIDSLQCSTANGTCLTGCRAGYVGPLCKEECDMSHYGYNCNETCGHCKDQAHCSPVYGTCLTGCRKGYFGRLCKEDANSNGRRIKFYSLIGALGFSAIIISILIIYMIKRRNHNNQLRYPADVDCQRGAALNEYKCV